MKTINQEEARVLVRDYKGSQFFTVSFIKRGDGSLRVMNCRKGVKKDVKGVGHRYNVASKGLICVRDVQKKAFRMIALESIKHIKLAGQEYKVVP